MFSCLLDERDENQTEKLITDPTCHDSLDVLNEEDGMKTDANESNCESQQAFGESKLVLL